MRLLTRVKLIVLVFAIEPAKFILNKMGYDFDEDLISNPTRLRITTIDTFCQMLRRQLMFETKDAIHGEPTEDPMVLYHKFFVSELSQHLFC